MDPLTYVYYGMDTISDEIIEEMKIKGIKKLHIRRKYFLPNAIITNFTGNLDNLYEGLEELYIYFPNFTNSLNNLPSTLKILYIDCYQFNKPLDYLPQNLISLTIISNSFNQLLDNLPNNLAYLKLDCHIYNNKLLNLPCSLIKLDLRIDDFIYFNTNFVYLKNLKELRKLVS